MSDDHRMRALLSAIGRGDDCGTPMSNQLLVDDLGWTPRDVAAMLHDAKAEMLIWGLRTGGNPQPNFEEIELTVQGKRFLRRAAEAT